MTGRKRRNLLPRRRRHDDEGEEDGSTAGDADHYASSEASLATDPDRNGDVSADSADETNAQSSTASPVLSKHGPTFQTTADTEAMLNGLKIAEGEKVEEIEFGATQARSVSADGHLRPVPAPTSKQRNGGKPPTQSRKAYFLHDDRNTSPGLAQPGFRGRGRGFAGPGGRGYGPPPSTDTTKNWVHDLHDTINQPPVPVQLTTPPPPPPKPANPPTQPAAATAAAAPPPTTAPNRSFSTTTVLGNVPVNVSLPGIDKSISKSMVKKHYTLLPQHRPPLRRDKPVRISIPDEHPRYIFPSTERSFIFIPRAMRPSQQQYRARGRGSFHASRRPSMFGGSNYTPSVGMSRRPSIAASASGIHTPTGITMPQYLPGMQKPVVRLPAPQMSFFPPTAQNAEVYMGDDSAIIHSPPATLPMHQPTPQKAVSVDQIESPTMSVPQQPHQPFHQQIPQDLQTSQLQHQMPHIPEGAVYAQPFQPYPAFQPPGYYGTQYPGQMMPPADFTAYGYGMYMGSPVMAQSVGANTGAQRQMPTGPVAHESNGTVYYYDPSQQYMLPQMMMGMNVMQPGAGQYYYPPMHNPMFYQ